MAASRNDFKDARGARRDALPSLADSLILEMLDDVPPVAPKIQRDVADKARRELIAASGRWLVLNTRAALNEAWARRLARSY